MIIRRVVCCAAVALFATSFAVPAEAAQPVCGSTITSSIVLTQDVGSSGLPCPAPGLEIQGSGFTVDLNHHTVWGNDTTTVTSTGIQFLAGTHNVTLKNGLVHGFHNGLGAASNHALSITAMVLANDAIGVSFSGTAGLKFFHNVATHNTISGFDILSSEHAKVRHNVSTRNAYGMHVNVEKGDFIDNVAASNTNNGIEVESFGAPVSGNVSAANGGEGIVLEEGGTRALNNTSIGNHGDGFSMFPLTPLLLKGNRSFGNGGDGYVVHGDGATFLRDAAQGNDAIGINALGSHENIRSNRVDGNEGLGIFVDGTNERVERNHVTGNYDTGIKFSNASNGDASRNLLTGNGMNGGVADGGFFGLDVGSSTVGGSRNSGSANNGAPCSTASMCLHPTTNFPLTTFACAASVDHSVRLQADVGSGTPCKFDGLEVTADNVTIDLNGFSVLGNGTSDEPGEEIGINLNFHSGVKIINGGVRGFEVGIERGDVGGSKGQTTVSGVVAANNTDEGILVDGLHTTVVSNAVVNSHFFAGITTNASGAVVKNNVVVGGTSKGFTATDHSRLSQDVVRDVGDVGIDSVVSDIKDSTVRNTAKAGIHAFDSHVVRNVVALAGLGSTNFNGLDEDGAGTGESSVLRDSIARSGGAGFEIQEDNLEVSQSIAAASKLGGVELNGQNSTLERSIVDGNLKNGVGLFGQDESLTRDRVYGSEHDGVEAIATNASITRSDVSANGDDGVHIDPGNAAVVDRNRLVGDGFGNGTGFGAEAPVTGVTGSNTGYGDAHDPPCTSTLC